MTERKEGKYNGDMPTEADFVRAVIARPEDDAPRLVYADWLDEQGRGEHAEFIRVQCEIARPSGCPSCLPRGTPGRVVGSTVRGRIINDADCPNCIAALRRRERELYCFENTSRWAHFPDFFAEFQWRRGFVEFVTCTAKEWLKHADAILVAQPVREVTLTTPVPVEFAPHVRFLENKLVARVPFADGSRQEAFNRSNYTPTQMVLSLLGQKWPGIKFAIPDVGDLVFPPLTEEEQWKIDALFDRWGIRR